ncbi:MAG TPA: hypothetical protein VF611_20575 [Pyrinomonadaceae bacterium]
MKRTLRGVFVGIIFQALTATVSACPECRAKVEGGIYNQNFLSNLLFMLLPVLVITVTGVGLYHADAIAKRIKEEVGRWQTKETAVR